jgi:hypothetical protein
LDSPFYDLADSNNFETAAKLHPRERCLQYRVTKSVNGKNAQQACKKQVARLCIIYSVTTAKGR